MLTKEELHKIDCYAGARVREARKEAGLSQEKLAKQCGVSFQQLQKYENGNNRLSVSRLCQIAEILEKPVFWFVPHEYGGTLAMHAIKLDRVIEGYREREDAVMAILAGRL